MLLIYLHSTIFILKPKLCPFDIDALEFTFYNIYIKTSMNWLSANLTFKFTFYNIYIKTTSFRKPTTLHNIIYILQYLY